jgi:DNA-binding GntR family transcriptional regulator
MDNSAPLSPIQQNTLAELVTKRLRDAIVSRQLQPGERLTEPSLAKQLGVSRSPIREALHFLEQERLVSSKTNRGTYVWDPTEDDVDEILSLRVMLESLAAEWVTETLTEEDFTYLEAAIEREKQAIADGDLLELIHQDRQFHEYVLCKASHSRLLEWWQQIMSQWEVLIYRRLQHHPGEIEPTVPADHAAILKALRAKNLEKVLQLHRSINQRVGKEVKAALRD